MAQDSEEPRPHIAAPEPGETSVGAKIRFLRQIFGLSRVAGQVIGSTVKRRRVNQGRGGEISVNAMLGPADGGVSVLSANPCHLRWPVHPGHRANFNADLSSQSRRC